VKTSEAFAGENWRELEHRGAVRQPEMAGKSRLVLADGTKALRIRLVGQTTKY
jgi:hypothetical protein